jgi:hypothetical protein
VDDFDPEAAALAVTDGLRPLGTPERAAQEKRYLKSDLDFLGVAVPDVRRVVKAAMRGQQGLDAHGMVAWAVALWRQPVHERRAAAVEILTLAAPRLAASDLGVLERLLRDSRTWAYVDGLAGNVAGEIALRDPADAWPRIDAWAVDEDFWVRRSARCRCCAASAPERRTWRASPATRSRCWRRRSSSSARRSGGCCGRPHDATRPGWRNGQKITYPKYLAWLFGRRSGACPPTRRNG